MQKKHQAILNMSVFPHSQSILLTKKLHEFYLLASVEASKALAHQANQLLITLEKELFRIQKPDE